MSANFDELEKEARQLNAKEKAKLARTLIDDLDAAADENAEALWLEEAQRRYEAYRAGKLQAVSGEDAMQRARQRLR